MPIILPQGFEITSKQPIDTRILLKKTAMLSMNDNIMPIKYFAICVDDGKLYLYNKANEVDPETGKFRVLESNVDLSNYVTQEQLQQLTALLDSLATKESVEAVKTNVEDLAGRVNALEQKPTTTPKLEDLNQEQVVVLFGGSASGWGE